MGQQPRIEPDPDDLPRTSLEPGPPPRWRADRPGDISGPRDMPWGGAFGTPGPDTGYALRLVDDEDLSLEPGERRAAVVSTVAQLMAARASLFGRAPTPEDRDVAVLLLGLSSGDEIPSQHRQELIAARRHWAPGVARSATKARQMVAMVPEELLLMTPEDVRHRLALGENPLKA